jgi:sugar phosphate isomerase/epimerase
MVMSVSPRIYLALDNCFAIKRWIKPLDWLQIAKELGFNYVQASTDNEIDPLFSPPDYMDEWFEEVKQGEKKTGVKVSTFYTGYQTYRTAGLAHHNKSMVRRLKENWIFEMVNRVSSSGARGFGFSLFAIPEPVMQSPEKYNETERRIIDVLRETGDYAHEHNDIQVSFEQMYVPYQPPFTIAQTERYLKAVYEYKKHPVYVTLDTGHMIGQIKFLKPGKEELLQYFESNNIRPWLGGDEVYELLEKYKESGNFSEGIEKIFMAMSLYPYMFAEKEDADEFAWFERLAKYSPIVHMQQTDGVKAGHAAFTKETAKYGIITGERLFKAIKKSYDSQEEIIPPVSEIFLSFELFFSNMSLKFDILSQLKETLNYWRRFIPEDGMTLDEIIELIE